MRMLVATRQPTSSFVEQLFLPTTTTTTLSTCRRNLASTASSNAVHERIQALVNDDKVFVFMKGTPDEPMCGFSRAVMQVMKMHGVKFGAQDVLADADIRQGVKEFSSWPTIPQVYIDGEFVGGCDIIVQLHQSGELIDTLRKAGIESKLVTRAKAGQFDID